MKVSRADIEVFFPITVQEIRDVGKLIGEWGNVYQHCLTVAVVADILSRYLVLGFEVVVQALAHDVTKRLERRPQDFTAEEADVLRKFWEEIPENIRMATAPLIEEVATQETIEEMVLRWADMSTYEDQVVGHVARFKKARERWPDLSPTLHMEYGEKMAGAICDALTKREIYVAPDQLLDWVKAQIQEN
ncbi:hypothetical protein A3A21_02895 [Candidatus Jorgensenbacteria bacterium RIFCSPLOWO2_01_FULL_45_25b]|uniref:HD domain-containing protein n=1 Tax=Candidatus Jorgensenbacteria bacterium RIFCSPLOWO2_01_FULL_45_25b TaxID=1798471 RepID=A0A1F6BTL2_9BACT|nr:MAG: hypothetical protein A3A21_02895 [Candidatus Jorgensenbacteria bacterium RIFCSPLOWO2_01_FULL_45_25b]